ncbi:stealth family protein [Chitinivibrio alkaliphilus]|uniref:Uncharacterized protein n=1 Tax=Chitinivibrio alkaliphilus ACht1 TaxID=1313304 RepID=U7D8E2_9BACT|nr:stealth family protein [Chitinivibrio alkaliphilus]ERP31337.1 hypothetical protein CALK_1827 [Chitinivibrio alkaliphilus ACht1]
MRYLDTLPVDFVYTWVNDQDPAWQRRKQRALGGSTVEAAAVESCRFVNSDELRYSLRSIYTYCPWFRKIFIVTDQQIPPWLCLDDPRVEIIDHQEIFQEEGTLPCFNSSAIECRLHHIPDLASHWIYLNDDFFIGRSVEKSFFFTPKGLQNSFSPPP